MHSWKISNLTHHLMQARFWCKVITHHCCNTTSFSPWFTNKAISLPAPYLPVPAMNKQYYWCRTTTNFFYRYSCLTSLLQRKKYIHLGFLFIITDTWFPARIFAHIFTVASTDVYMIIYYFSWVHSLIPHAWRIIMCQTFFLLLRHVWNTLYPRVLSESLWVSWFISLFKIQNIYL